MLPVRKCHVFNNHSHLLLNGGDTPEHCVPRQFCCHVNVLEHTHGNKDAMMSLVEPCCSPVLIKHCYLMHFYTEVLILCGCRKRIHTRRQKDRAPRPQFHLLGSFPNLDCFQMIMVMPHEPEVEGQPLLSVACRRL